MNTLYKNEIETINNFIDNEINIYNSTKLNRSKGISLKDIALKVYYEFNNKTFYLYSIEYLKNYFGIDNKLNDFNKVIETVYYPNTYTFDKSQYEYITNNHKSLFDIDYKKPLTDVDYAMEDYFKHNRI